jgi:D-alanyl-D-alanine carboxypeptidase
VKAGANTIPALMALAPVPQATVAPQQFALTRRDDIPSAIEPLPPAADETTADTAPATYQTASAATTPVAPPAPVVRGGWLIQVGAFPEEEKAKERLREAQMLGKNIVAKANPFTEKVMKGKQEMYRARFAGFDQTTAEAACHYFKRNDIACMAMKN